MTVPTELLRSIEPRQVAAWMRSRGWALVDTVPQHTARYHLDAGTDGIFEVDLPLRTTFQDYPRRMAEVVQTLAAAAGRPVPWILSEVQAATVDIIRLRATGPGVGAGRVPVDLGTRLFAQTRELLLAAASAAHEPRAVYRTRKPAEAMDFLRKVKLAAPEEGSFIITVHAPVPPSLQAPLTEDLDEPPFERRSTLMLAHASAAARQAAETAGLGGDASPFLAGTRQGISANLCEALAGFVDGEETTALELLFSWAPSRAVPAGTPTALHLGADLAPVLQEGARLLRARAPLDDFELEGFVVRLESPDADQGGVAVVTAPVDGHPRKIRIPMGSEDYALAIRAHKDRQLLRCEGELRRVGRGWQLDRVRHVERVEDEEEG